MTSEEPGEPRNVISGGMFIGPVLQGRDIQVTFQGGPTNSSLPGSLAHSPDGARQIVVGEIPPRPVAFLERNAVAELGGAWDAGRRVTVVQAVTGSPGVGKTQAAAAYARDRVAVGWPLVAWVTAETSDQLLVGLTNVAAAVGVADPNGDSTVSAGNVRRYLETCPGPALVVLDNATDPEGLAAFMPSVGPVQVVITSTDRAFTRLGMTVEVGLFTAEQSMAYLKERTGLDDANGAAVVAAELGQLPLALAQAATVINQQNLDYESYQRRLRSASAAKYLTSHVGDPYPRGAVDAITLAIQSVEEQDNSGLTRMIIGLFAVLSAEGVDRSVIVGLASLPIAASSIASADTFDEAVDQALGRLVGGSILTRTKPGQALIMHRLISRVVRERDQAQGRLISNLRNAVDLLQALQLPEQEGWRQRRTGSQLVEQVNAVWAASLGWSDPDDPHYCEISTRLISLRNWSVAQLIAAEDLSRAIGLGRTVLENCERLQGADHPDTLRARDNLAGAYASAGQLREAIALYERNLDESERLLGADDPDVLVPRNNLASAYESLGRLREAIALYERNLEISERLQGTDHHDTLNTRNNLGGAYASAGRRREAIAVYERNLDDCERLLGPDRPETLTSRNNLAGAYVWAGRLPEALALYERSLDESERVLGADDPETLVSRNNLASAYEAIGRRRIAVALHERNFAECERLLGADHPYTLNSRNGLAEAYASAGRRREAIVLYERNLCERERLLGPNHPETLNSRNNLAYAYASSGRLRRAILLFRQNATEAGRALEVGHPYRQPFRRFLWKAPLFAVILGLVVFMSIRSAWIGKYQDAIGWLLLPVLFLLWTTMIRPALRRLLAARDWKFLRLRWVRFFIASPPPR